MLKEDINMRVNNLILKPIVTEKTYSHSNANRYVFQVNMAATKGSVATDIKKIYGVDVIEVKMLIMPGKAKRIGQTRDFNKPMKFKKAVVKLKEGQSIDLFPKE
jgi:large subunit ribosomal protein L23